MIENVTIVDKNGNGILAEGLMYINVKTTNTKYVFYTLNEMVDADQTKIYIAETADAVGQASPIEEEEWKFLKKTMVSIAHKEELPDIEHIKMTGITFNISEPKKLAVKLPVKQALKDTQFEKTLNSVGEPIAPQGGNTFFDQSLVAEQNVVEQQPATQEMNIFSNPPQPIVQEQPIVETAGVVNNQNTVGGIVNPIEQPVTPVPTPVVNNAEQSIVQNQLIETGTEEVPQFIETPTAKTEPQLPQVEDDKSKFADEPVLGVAPTQVATNVLVEESNLAAPQPTEVAEIKEEQKEAVPETAVTKEEAVEAMVTLIKYFGMSNELSSQLANSIAKETKQNEIKSEEPEMPQVVPVVEVSKEVSAPVETTSSLLGGESLLGGTLENNVASSLAGNSPISGIIQTVAEQPNQNASGTEMTTEMPETQPVEDTAITQELPQQTVEMVQEIPPVIETPQVGEASQQPEDKTEIVEEEFKNPMSFEATGTQAGNMSPIANIIDTSVQGIKAAAPAITTEEPLNPGLTPVEFNTPEVVMPSPSAGGTGTLQPTTPPPMDNADLIPDVTPKAAEPEVYTHTAQGNNGQVVIPTQETGQIEGPQVIMPDNAKNVQMVTQGMQGQGTLGPSGLVADPRTLNLTN